MTRPAGCFSKSSRPKVSRINRTAMYFYIFKRLLLMIPTLLGAAALVFVLMRLIPGDICVMRLATGGGSINPEVLKSCRLELGMDRPVLVQFLLFLKGLATFDLG